MYVDGCILEDQSSGEPYGFKSTEQNKQETTTSETQKQISSTKATRNARQSSHFTTF